MRINFFYSYNTSVIEHKKRILQINWVSTKNIETMLSSVFHLLLRENIKDFFGV